MEVGNDADRAERHSPDGRCWRSAGLGMTVQKTNCVICKLHARTARYLTGESVLTDSEMHLHQSNQIDSDSGLKAVVSIKVKQRLLGRKRHSIPPLTCQAERERERERGN
jgi:hypothetical protein